MEQNGGRALEEEWGRKAKERAVGNGTPQVPEHPQVGTGMGAAEIPPPEGSEPSIQQNTTTKTWNLEEKTRRE